VNADYSPDARLIADFKEGSMLMSVEIRLPIYSRNNLAMELVVNLQLFLETFDL
jgi:hypothetical protein